MNRGKRLKQISAENSVEFYNYLPKERTDFDDFHRLTSLRLKTLFSLESGKTEYLVTNILDKESDILSHFYTRMLCAQSLWTTNWFVNQECSLFKNRIKRIEDSQINDIFSDFFSHLRKVDLKNELIPSDAFYSTNKENKEIKKGIKVHFKFVIDLLMNRKVKLTNGFVILEKEMYKSIMINFFRKHLESKMNYLYKYYINNPEERFKTHFNNSFLSSSKITESNIAKIQPYLPPCIDLLIKKAKNTNHLKFNDRQTLTLFFKEAGISVEECIVFFKSIFKMGDDVFNKKYLYGIKHNYGLEGKRANYKSYSCDKIIMNSADKDCFSCPFKRKYDLTDYFNEKNIEPEEINDIYKEADCKISCSILLNRIKKNEESIVNSPITFLEKMINKE